MELSRVIPERYRPQTGSDFVGAFRTNLPPLFEHIGNTLIPDLRYDLTPNRLSFELVQQRVRDLMVKASNPDNGMTVKVEPGQSSQFGFHYEGNARIVFAGPRFRAIRIDYKPLDTLIKVKAIREMKYHPQEAVVLREGNSMGEETILTVARYTKTPQDAIDVYLIIKRSQDGEHKIASFGKPGLSEADQIELIHNLQMI